MKFKVKDLSKCIGKSITIPVAMEKFKSPKIPKFIICDNPEIAKIVDIYYLTPIFPTITEESSIIQISTPKS